MVLSAQDSSLFNGLSCVLLQTEQFAVLWILFALIVVGNASVLLALLLSKKRKSRMNFFIMQLALAG
jgi:neuropeptide S receptor 1